ARIALIETTPVKRPRRPYLIALAGDGRRLAHVLTRENSPTSQVTIWDYRAAKSIVTFLAHTANITSLAFSPDGAFLATGSNDRTLIVGDRPPGREVLTPRAPLDRVSCPPSTPAGRFLASGSDDRTVRIWNTRGE